MHRIPFVKGIFLALALACLTTGTAESRDPVMADYTAMPVFLASSVPPNILIQLDTSASMNSMAYGYLNDSKYHPDAFGAIASGYATGGSETTLEDQDVSFIEANVQPGDIVHNLDDRSLGVVTSVAEHKLTIADGMSDGQSNDAGERFWIESQQLKNPDEPEEGYYGYFVPTARYRYVGGVWSKDSNGYFVRDDSNGEWSGNFLNFLTMRRRDIAKKVLIGGKTGAGDRDGNGEAILEGAGDDYTGYWWWPKFSGDQEGHSPYTERSFYVLKNGYVEVFTIEEGDRGLNYAHDFTHSAYPPAKMGDPMGFEVTDYDFQGYTSSKYKIIPHIPLLTGVADNVYDPSQDPDVTDPDLEPHSYYYLYDPSKDFSGVIKPDYKFILLDKNNPDAQRGEAIVYSVPNSVNELIQAFKDLFGNDDGEAMLYDMFSKFGGGDSAITCKYNCDPDEIYTPCNDDSDWWRCEMDGDLDTVLAPLIGHIVIFDPDSITYPEFVHPTDQYPYKFIDPDPIIARRVAYYRVAVKRDASYSDEAGEFMDGDPAGILQRFSDRVRFGFMIFNVPFGTEDADGGMVTAPIGSSMAEVIAQIEEAPANSSTPLAETLYEASRYFQQNVERAYWDFDYYIGLKDGVQWDPYVYNDADAWCLPSFVLQISDGEPYLDTKFDRDWGISDEDGDGYLDDVAYYAHTTDLRAAGGKELPGTQSLTYYSIFAFGRGSDLLKKAARRGGFEDVNGDLQPEPPGGDPDLIRREWDKNEDGIPDNYFEAQNGYELESRIYSALTSMLKQAATATAVTVLSTSSRGEGTVYQSYFLPVVTESLEQITWLGFLQALWVDQWGNLRLDSVPDGHLVLNEDKIARYFFDVGEQKTFVLVYSDSDADGVIDNPDEDNDGMPDPELKIPLVPEEGLPEDIPSLWEAGKKLAKMDPSSRKIYTFVDLDWDMVKDTSPEELVEFTTANVSTISPFLHVDSSTYYFLDSSNGKGRAENLIEFIRGNPIPDFRKREVTVDGAKRTWKLGDIVYSTPTVVAAPKEYYHYIYGDISYATFVEQYKDRYPMLYVGANDGMLHAFRAGRFISGDDPSTGKVENGYFDFSDYSNLGTEAWAYVPFNLLPHLKWLADPNYTHVYYVDQKPKVADVQIFPDDSDHPGGWGTLLVAGFRLGGGPYTTSISGTSRTFRSAYVLMDVTNPQWSEPKVLAEFTHPDMGFSTTYPAIARVGDQWFLIVGSGPTDYDGLSDQTAKVFILNLSQFMMSKVISEGQNLYIKNLSDAKAFTADPISVDVDPNPLTSTKDHVDVIYMGETYGDATQWNGRMIRILTNGNTNPSTWQVSTLIQTKVHQPITAAPTVAVGFSKEVWVYFGTGRFFSVDDLSDTHTQSLYGVHDQCFDSESSCTDPQATVSELLDVTSAQVTAGTGQVTGLSDISTFQELLSLFKGTSPIYPGWRLDLLDLGERSIAPPRVIGGLALFTTFTPPTADICSFGGTSRLYGLYFTTGTAHPRAPLGQEGGISLRSMVIGTGAPSAVGLHVGTKEGVTAFIQNSTGDISQEDVTPPIKFKTGVTAWRQR